MRVSPPDLEAVIFDVGNTLLYLDYARLAELFARHGVVRRDFSFDDAAQAERFARPRLSDYLNENRASTEDPRSFRRYVELALETAGSAASPGALDAAFVEICREQCRSNFFSVPAPGALEAVAALAPRFKLGVISNAGGKVASELAAAGFAGNLLAIVDSGLEGVAKPDPRIFRSGCERVGVAPERALYVGDIHSVDVLGARGAGLDAVLLDPAGAYAARGYTAAPLYRDVADLARELLSGRA
jgi:FMN phosphatase YigB (HAD superfamily)